MKPTKRGRWPRVAGTIGATKTPGKLAVYAKLRGFQEHDKVAVVMAADLRYLHKCRRELLSLAQSLRAMFFCARGGNVPSGEDRHEDVAECYRCWAETILSWRKS